MRLTSPGQATALIGEDNRRDAEWVVRALETFGVQKVFVAVTGEEALAFLADQPCDVVLVDYRLPGVAP